MRIGPHIVTQSEVAPGTKRMPFIRYWDGENWYKCDLYGYPWGKPDNKARTSILALEHHPALLAPVPLKPMLPLAWAWLRSLKGYIVR